MNYLPTHSELTQAILNVFNNDSSIVLTTQEINNKVIQLLSIPDDILQIEEANGSSSQFSYLMRWARTELKQKHKLINVERGKWKLL